jgi:two-component system response regulator YesN
MLRLMIVDDENLFREALKKSIPWYKLGFDVCCEAENGYDALEKISEFKPDIALVDINMPVMDGLELAAEIKEKELDVKVIIITGYGEFNYARQAMEVGVFNYLLKPVDDRELMEALSAIKSRIEKECRARIETEELIRQVNNYKPVLKEVLLNDLIKGNRLFALEEISSLQGCIDVDLHSKSYQAAVIELDEKEEYGWTGETRQIHCFTVASIAAEVLREYCAFEFCRDTQGRLNVLLFPEGAQGDGRRDAVSAFEMIRLSIPKSLGFTISVGIGRPYGQIRELAVSYREALYAVKNKLVIGDNCVIPYADIPECKLNVNFYPIERKMQLLISLRVGDVSDAKNIIGAVFDGIRANNPPGETARFACIGLVSSLIEYAAESGNETKEIFGEGIGMLEEVQSKKNLDELETWILGLLSQISGHIRAGRSKRPSRIVEEAKKYIDANYASFDLRIDEIAKNVYVKYGHLCFLFKRETGKTINEYIGELRICKAKELIDGGCQSIAMVAARVGYADANYFSKCFKKLAGISPGKYIENFING